MHPFNFFWYFAERTKISDERLRILTNTSNFWWSYPIDRNKPKIKEPCSRNHLQLITVAFCNNKLFSYFCSKINQFFFQYEKQFIHLIKCHYYSFLFLRHPTCHYRRRVGYGWFETCVSLYINQLQWSDGKNHQLWRHYRRISCAWP